MGFPSPAGRQQESRLGAEWLWQGSCVRCLPGGFAPLTFWRGTKARDCPAPAGDVSGFRLFFSTLSLESLYPKTDPVSSGQSQATEQLQNAAGLGTGVLPSDQPSNPHPGTSSLSVPLLAAFGSVRSMLLVGAN